MNAQADRVSTVERAPMALTVTRAHARGLTSERDARVSHSLIVFTNLDCAV